MDIPNPPQAVAALAAFVRERLNEVSGTLTPLWSRGDGAQLLAADAAPQPDRSVVGAARQLALVIVGAAAPFAPTSYARARLLRQMHASGLLTDEHARQTRELFELEEDSSGAPR